MARKIKLLTIVGTRPQFIKSATFSRALNKFADEYRNVINIEEVLVHTGQHYDANMSEIFFEELGMKKEKYNLNINGGLHGEQTGRMMVELEKVVLKENPHILIVFGDTNSTLAGALVGAKLQIPVAHIEAGFRSFDRAMPEEINRILTDVLSSQLYCFTESCVGLLEREDIKDNVYFVGDINYDSLLYETKSKRWSLANFNNVFKKIGHNLNEPFIYCTIHRASNTDNRDSLINIFEALIKSKKKIIIPLHPRTRKMLEEHKLFDHYAKYKNLLFIEPLSYFDNLIVAHKSDKIITDSGGLIKEAVFLGKPCIVLRKNIEFFEAVKLGEAILVGTATNKILDAIKNFQGRLKPIKRMSEHDNFYGDGHAAERIVAIMLEPYVRRYRAPKNDGN